MLPLFPLTPSSPQSPHPPSLQGASLTAVGDELYISLGYDGSSMKSTQNKTKQNKTKQIKSNQIYQNRAMSRSDEYILDLYLSNLDYNAYTWKYQTTGDSLSWTFVPTSGMVTSNLTQFALSWSNKTHIWYFGGKDGSNCMYTFCMKKRRKSKEEMM